MLITLDKSELFNCSNNRERNYKMLGLEMMLKSMGLDPEKIKTDMHEAQEKFSAVVAQLNEKLDNISAKLDNLKGE